MQHRKIHTATSKKYAATSKNVLQYQKIFATTLKNMYYNIAKINRETWKMGLFEKTSIVTT